MSNFTNGVSSVDSEEIKKFNKESDIWWKPRGEMRMLKALNKIRVPFVHKELAKAGKLSALYKGSNKPLSGLKILDVGCGGGYLSEALARLGAETTGIDAAGDLIKIAKDHMKHDKQLLTKLNYKNITIEEMALKHKDAFDVVVSSEVIEHVLNQDEFVRNCIECLKPGGSIFITTISRTLMSKIFGIWAAEYIFKFTPIGTHEHDKFITPKELKEILKDYNCRPKKVIGYTINPLTHKWFHVPTTQVSYAVHATKKMLL